MISRLFVGNLPFNTTEVEVLELFKQVGTVSKCELILDKFTNKSRGFAFVEMGSPEEATNAVTALNGKEVGGRLLTVTEARPREERPRFAFNGERHNNGNGYAGNSGYGREHGKREFHTTRR